MTCLTAAGEVVHCYPATYALTKLYTKVMT